MLEILKVRNLLWSTRVRLAYGRAMIKASPIDRIKASAAVETKRLGLAIVGIFIVIPKLVKDEGNGVILGWKSVDNYNLEVFVVRKSQSSHAGNEGIEAEEIG